MPATLLTIEVTGQPGADIPGEIIPELVRLARVTGCSIRCKANGRLIIAYQDNQVEDLVAAWRDDDLPRDLIMVRQQRSRTWKPETEVL